MRRRRQKRAIAAQKVSIHASVKDATRRDSRVAFHLPSFNPRICKRCDTALFGTIERVGVSIHASVKDATGETRELRFIYQVSIHASVKDATNCFIFFCCYFSVSIHASVKDATIAISINL